MPDKIRPPKASFHDLIDWFSKLFGPVGAVIAVMYGKLFKLMPEKQGEFNSFVADELNSNRENITQILSDLCESHKDSYQGRNSNGTFVIKQSGFVEFETKLIIGPEEQVIELTPPIQLDSGCFESITVYGGEFERVQLSPQYDGEEKCFVKVKASPSNATNKAIARGSGWVDGFKESGGL